MFGRAMRIAWEAAPRQTVITTSLQVLSGVGLAAQLLIAKQFLAVMLGDHGPVSLQAVLPDNIALTLVTATLQFAAMASAEVSRVLSGLIEQQAIGQVAEAATSIDLLDYERPEFHDALQRAPVSYTHLTLPTKRIV